jgi:hypothetical protein
MAHQRAQFLATTSTHNLFSLPPFHPHLCPEKVYLMQVISIHIGPEFEAFPNLKHITQWWGTERAAQVSRLPRGLPYIFDHVRPFVPLLSSLSLSKRLLCLFTLFSPTATSNPFTFRPRLASIPSPC